MTANIPIDDNLSLSQKDVNLFKCPTFTFHFIFLFFLIKFSCSLTLFVKSKEIRRVLASVFHFYLTNLRLQASRFRIRICGANPIHQK